MHAKPGLQLHLLHMSRSLFRPTLEHRPAMQEHSAGGVTPRAAPVIFSIADLTAALGLASHLALCQGCISWQAVRDGITSISHGAALELRDRTTLKALAELILAEEPAQAALQGALGLPGCPPLGNSLQSFRYSICMPAGRLKVQRAALCSHGMALHAVFGPVSTGEQWRHRRAPDLQLPVAGHSSMRCLRLASWKPCSCTCNWASRAGRCRPPSCWWI